MTLKLEVGKKYRNRRGEVVDIISEISANIDYPFLGINTLTYAQRTYAQNGRYVLERENSVDLIEEVIEPAQEPVKKPHKWHKEIIAIAKGKIAKYKANKLDGITDWVDGTDAINPIVNAEYELRIAAPQWRKDLAEKMKAGGVYRVKMAKNGDKE